MTESDGGALDALKESTIMMVDDEPTTLDVLEMFLEGEGYHSFVRTSDSTLAFEIVSKEAPDVLLLDLMMPDVDGLEILAAIRDDTHLRHMPVIILTSSTDAETKLKALELGATDFLGKPVDPSELALRLRNTLAAKAYQDRLAYCDRLTGLPNRRAFVEKLGRALRHAREGSLEGAMIHIDLDRFKQINDTLSHSTGDALLKAVSERLEKSVRPTDLMVTPEMIHRGSSLSRVGGDEFSLFLPGAGSFERAARAARRLLSALAEPFSLGTHDLFVTASIGIALFPDDGSSIDSLMRHADIAMAHVKREGGNDYQFYSDSLNTETIEQLSLESQLRKALEREELLLHYQPKVDVPSGKIVGVECLMRWEHPELGLVPPARFIPLAEDTGVIGALGEFALRAACQQNTGWQRAGHPPIRISVNVSGKQFRRSRRLVESIREALEDSRMDAQYLVLELTESAIMDDPRRTAETLREIRDMGVRLSLDDFGTGYSSLGSLRSFPIDELKIDRSFVKGVPRDENGAAIVNAIIAMAKSLGMTVVAEGVETAEQLAFLEERGCDEYQGYLFSRPVVAEGIATLFAGQESDSRQPAQGGR